MSGIFDTINHLITCSEYEYKCFDSLVHTTLFKNVNAEPAVRDIKELISLQSDLIRDCGLAHKTKETIAQEIGSLVENIQYQPQPEGVPFQITLWNNILQNPQLEKIHKLIAKQREFIKKSKPSFGKSQVDEALQKLVRTRPRNRGCIVYDSDGGDY